MPDVILAGISTECLLETCLNFPYLTDFLFANDYQQGFEVLTAEFNGFEELLKRKDLTGVLLKKYKSLITETTNIRSYNSVEQGMFSFRYFILELLLTQDVVFNKLSLEQDKQLFSLCFEHKKIKNSYSDIFSNLNALPVNLLYAKKALNDPDFKFESAEQKKALSDFIKVPQSIDQRIIDNIEKYINVNYK
jgi:hypothetical protein